MVTCGDRVCEEGDGSGWKGGSVAEKEKGKSRDAGREAGMEIALGWKWECGAYVACTFEDSAYASGSLFFLLLFREFDDFSARVLQWARTFRAPLRKPKRQITHSRQIHKGTDIDLGLLAGRTRRFRTR